MKEVTISARVPQELSDELTSLAQALRRDRSWVIEEALRSYIASAKQFLEAGDVVTHAEVVEMMRERRQRFVARGQ